MKSKKLISLLCAAAMSASAFAGLTVTASAATDLVTLDGSTADGWVAPDGTDKGDIVPTVTIDDGETDQYLKFQGSGGGNRKSTYSLGQTISGQYTIEYDTMMTRGNGMSRIMHSNQLAFTNDTSTKDTRDGAGIIDTVNAQQGTKYNSGSGASVANAAMKTDLRPYLTDKWVINDDSTSELVAYPESAVEVADTKWVRVQAAVNNDKTTVTVIDKSGNKLVDGVEYTNSTNEINSIYVCSNRGDGGSGIVALDNLHIYQGAPETLTTDGLRGDATVVVPTVMPVPDVKTQAPGLSAPDGVTPVVNNTFSKALASTAMGETATTITDVDGLSIAMGNRTGGDTATTVSVEDWAAGDKVLTLAGGPYSGAGRGPVVSAVDSLELADGKSSVMTFAVNLGSTKAGGAGRLYILKDNSQAGTDKNGAYNNVMGVLTTDDTASSYTIGSSSNVVTIGQQVEAYEWYKVAVIVSSDKFRIWVAKADEDFTEKPQVDCDHVGTGDTASSFTALPLLAVTSEKGGSYTGSVARIDNMLTYSGTADQPRKLLPTSEAAPTPAPIPAKVTMSVDETANTVTLTSDKDTNAVLVQASYRTDNTLDSVKKVVNVALTAGTAYTVPATDLDAFTTNDKIMVWDSLKTMTPLASAYTIKNGAAQATAKPAPTAEPTEAPAETGAPTTEPTEAPAETVAPTDTPAPTATAVPTYAVSGTVDAGVKSVTLTDKAEAENTITGKIEDTTVTFTGVKAGTYTVSAVAASGKDIYTIKVGDTETTEVTVTDANVTNLAVTSKDEAVLPYADGTNTYDTEGAANSFVDYSRVTVSIADGVNGNTTKVQNLKTGNGSSGAGYNPYTVAFPAKGEAVATSFDISIPTRNAWVSVRGTQPGTNDRNNNAAGRIFTIGAEGSAVIKIYSGADVVDEITGTDIITKWYHVDAVVNNTTKKVAIKVYDYKANNNYTKETALYDKTVDFRDNTVAGVVAMDYHSNTANANMQIDNLYINDPSYVTPINVTATDVTVDKAQVVKDDVITITPTVPAGKKLSAVKVNGTAVTAVDGKYTYTVTGEESAIAVTADFVRADVDNVVVSSTNTDVQIGQKGTYKATVYADADKKIDITKDSAITWSVESATEGVSLADGTVMAQDGTLTVAADQAVGKLTVKATAVKDIASSDDTDANKVVGTFEVNVIAEKSFQVVAATVENGKVAFKVGDTENATSFKESETLEIVPTANAGYELDSVSYKLTSAEDDTYTTVTATEGKYTVAGNAIAGDITVKVTFKAINYKITNNTVAENGNSIAIRIGDTEAATAIVGQTITIVPTIANGYKLKSISVKNGNTDVTVTNNTFTMPAADVTVEATFEEWNGIYYSQDFESYADTDAVKADWVSASYPAGVTLVTGDTTYGQYLSMDDGTQNGRGVRVTLPASAEVTGQYKVSFDANVKKGNIANRTESSISIGGKDAKTANTNSTFGSGYLFEMVVANDTGIATVSGMTENNTFTPTDATWYHYDLTVDTEAKTVAVVITAKDEAATQLFSGTATINGNGVLKYIQLVGGKAYGKVLIDNIKVTAPWYTDASSGTEDGTGTEA